MKRFVCEIIDCEGYNDEIVISAKNYKDCQKILNDSYHVKRIIEVHMIGE